MTSKFYEYFKDNYRNYIIAILHFLTTEILQNLQYLVYIFVLKKSTNLK